MKLECNLYGTENHSIRLWKKCGIIVELTFRVINSIPWNSFEPSISGQIVLELGVRAHFFDFNIFRLTFRFTDFGWVFGDFNFRWVFDNLDFRAGFDGGGTSAFFDSRILDGFLATLITLDVFLTTWILNLRL